MVNKKLKILIVCSKNSGQISPFIAEQAEALNQTNKVEVEFFTIENKGWRGYLKSRKHLLLKIKQFQPDLLHAHFGLSGLLANLQRIVPVITTYHGCDINKASLRVLSVFPLLFSKFNIFVSDKQVNKVWLIAGKFMVLPCGIHLSNFYPIDKLEARKELGWSAERKVILFSSNFSRPEKNPSLANEAIKLVNDFELIELKGFTRREVCLAMNACDAGLLTSIREGSPMFIKELMACKRPIVSTNVGDVSELISNIEGCEIVNFDASDVAKAISKVTLFKCVEYPTESFNKIDNINVAQTLLKIYQKVVKK